MAKIALRDRIRTSRHRRPLVEVVEAGQGLARVLTARPEVRRAATVAAYVSIGSEPGTGALLDALTGLGKRVILPALQPDIDLDWGTWRGATSLAPARKGLLEPVDRLGVEAVATADVVLVPGLAVSLTGDRLGQGGGCYDRALGRVPGRHAVVICSTTTRSGSTYRSTTTTGPSPPPLTPTRWIPLR